MLKLLAEWWLQIWPNLAASALTFGAGLLWARRRLLSELERREAAHLAQHAETQRLLSALHIRLDAQEGK